MYAQDTKTVAIKYFTWIEITKPVSSLYSKVDPKGICQVNITYTCIWIIFVFSDLKKMYFKIVVIILLVLLVLFVRKYRI